MKSGKVSTPTLNTNKRMRGGKGVPRRFKAEGKRIVREKAQGGGVR